MKRTLITPNLDQIPKEFHSLLANSAVYDSSCSPLAKVFFIDKDDGYYLKRSPKGTLEKEVLLTKHFHSKKLSANVLEYLTLNEDWMLTERVCGEDCTHQLYLENPKRLCDTTAELLRKLHETSFEDCPVQNRSDIYVNTVIQNHKTGNYDKTAFPDSFGYKSAEEAWNVASKNLKYLKNDTLLHGDYCLPNIMLNDWKFTGFIDLDNAGVGDKHIDIFWGIWTLFFNLKTNEFAKRFIDAYGKNEINTDMLKVIAACEVFG